MNEDTESGYMSARASKIFQSKLELLTRESNWAGMVKMLKRYAKRYPNAYYVHQQLLQHFMLTALPNFIWPFNMLNMQ